MAEFKSFADLGNAFQGGLQNFAGTRHRYSPRDVSYVEDGLNVAGKRLEQYFRDRIDQSGPGWPALAEATIRERARTFYGGSKPLKSTEQLYDNITHHVTATADGMTVEVGVNDVEHQHTGTSAPINLEDLVLIHDYGVEDNVWGGHTTGPVPAREIFDFEDGRYKEFEEMVVHEFALSMFKAHKNIALRWTKQ